MATTHRFTHDQASNTIEHTVLVDGVQQVCRNYSAPQRDELLANSGNAAAPYVAIAGWTDEYIAAVIAEEQRLAALAVKKEDVLRQALDLREQIIIRLDGIAGRAVRAGDTTGIAAACDAAVASLIAVPTLPAVVNATTGLEAKAAIMTEWHAIATTLTLAAPSAATAFVGLGM